MIKGIRELVEAKPAFRVQIIISAKPRIILILFEII
jgi:hypothetical protein